MNPRVIVGLVGTIGAGKDFVSDYIVKKHGFQVVSMGDLVREEATNQGLEHTRENLQNLSREYTNEHGSKYWAYKVTDRILKLKWEKAIINGMRRVQELEVYRERFADNFRLILIDADPKIRFERLKNRAEARDPQTWEEFAKQEKNELKLYGTFEETIKLADYTVKNEGTPEQLFSKVDELIRGFTK